MLPLPQVKPNQCRVREAGRHQAGFFARNPAMKIGLIFPNSDRKDKTIHLGLGYIAAYARTKHTGLEFTLLDTRVATRSEVKNFYRTKFDLTGITVLSPVYHETILIFKKLKKLWPAVPVCLGGPYVTTLMEGIFEDTPAEFAVYGEGEITFSELIGYLKGQISLPEIYGLMYRDPAGQTIRNPPRAQIRNLDELPYPAWDLFPMHRYPMHRIAGSRGCPYKCVFCNSSAIWSAKWRKRSPENILGEIEYLLTHHQRKVFFFNDNSFNIEMSRVAEFCKLLIERNIEIMWSTPVRVDLITPELARLMRRAGCYNVGVGIESADDEILRNMKKQLTSAEALRGIQIFRDAGIEVLGQFVIGSPGDTLQTVTKSIAFAKSSGLDYVMFYSILPFRGTAQWEYVNREGTFFGRKIHDFHGYRPRVVFETPEFRLHDRLRAIALARKEGYYSETNNRSSFFDAGKWVAAKIQRSLPPGLSDPLYMRIKNMYRRHIMKWTRH